MSVGYMEDPWLSDGNSGYSELDEAGEMRTRRETIGDYVNNFQLRLKMKAVNWLEPEIIEINEVVFMVIVI